MYPSGETRIWNQVGRPSMLDGKMFLGATGMAILKIARMSTELEDWLPEPLTVAAWKVRSLTMGSDTGYLLYVDQPRIRGVPTGASRTLTRSEDRRSQGDHRGRGPGGSHPRRGRSAGGGGAPGLRRGRCRRRVLPGPPLQGSQGRAGSGGQGHLRPRRDGPQGPQARAGRGGPDPVRRRPDRPPSALDLARPGSSAGEAEGPELQPRGDTADHPCPVHGRAVLPGDRRRVQGR